jgi:hypothetical protein
VLYLVGEAGAFRTFPGVYANILKPAGLEIYGGIVFVPDRHEEIIELLSGTGTFFCSMTRATEMRQAGKTGRHDPGNPPVPPTRSKGTVQEVPPTPDMVSALQ